VRGAKGRRGKSEWMKLPVGRARFWENCSGIVEGIRAGM
jgi:hypothetical protein